MAVAKRIDGNAGAKVEKAAAITGSHPAALAALDGEWRTVVGGKNGA